MSYLVHLQQFEGPLGLLLYLIRKEEMDIFDINVGDITNQYFDYIRQMKELDLEVAGEFVAMAATLIQIKSRMLLPQYNDEGEPIEVEDPRKELVQKLLDYQKYQDAAKQLYERPLLGRDVFLRGTRENLYDNDEGEIIIEEDGLFSLISAYRKSVKRAIKAVHRVKAKVQSIAERVMEIQHKLMVGTRVMLSELIEIGSAPRRTQLLVTFLSMLELGRMGYVSLFQTDTYGEIYIDPIKPIERNVLERVQEFDSGDAEAVARSIINEAAEEKIDMNEAMQSAHDLVGDHVKLGLGESTEGPEHIADVEFAEALLRGETLAPEHVASDDEIFAAELELDRGWAQGSALEVVASDITPASAEEISANEALISTELADPAADFAAESAPSDEPSALLAETASPHDGDSVSSESLNSTYEVTPEYAAADTSLEKPFGQPIEHPVEAADAATNPENYASFADSLGTAEELVFASRAEPAAESAEVKSADVAPESTTQIENVDLAANDSRFANSAPPELSEPAPIADSDQADTIRQLEIAAEPDDEAMLAAVFSHAESPDFVAAAELVLPEHHDDAVATHLAEVELKAEVDLEIEAAAESADESLVETSVAREAMESVPERGFHAETGSLNEHGLASTNDEGRLPEKSQETRSGEGSAET